MARMIDADKLAEVLHADKIFDVPNEYWESAFGVPIVDAEIVVRCRDCKLHENCFTEDLFSFCGINDPYCCVGKRRTDDD